MKITPKLERDLRGARSKRYLVMGSDGHGRGVTAHRWDKLPADINVGDFDVLNLNFAAFEDEALADGLPLDRLPGRKVMARALFSPDTEIIAIGDPRTIIGNPTSGPYCSADYWLPYRLGVEDDNGTAYRVIAEEWQSYFDLVSRWSWIATGECEPYDQDPVQYLAPAVRSANHLAVQLEPIALSRALHAVAVRVRIQAQRTDYRNAELVSEACPVFWLPAPDMVSAAKGIDVILRERYGVANEARRPDWAASYVLPDVDSVREEIAQLEAKRRDLEDELSDTRLREAEAERPVLLLYEKGKEVLEPIVRDALRSLGARVEDPPSEGVEDGRLFRGDEAGIIEIKGRTGQVKQDDVRQIVQWAADAKGRDGIDFKPIIIGNPHCAMSLAERGEPFATNAKTYALNSGVALVTTVQLYEAVRLQQLRQFDEDAFWKGIFAAVGLAELPGFQGGVETEEATRLVAEGDCRARSWRPRIGFGQRARRTDTGTSCPSRGSEMTVSESAGLVIVAAWRAALDHAGLRDDHFHLIVCPGSPRAGNAPKAAWYEPGETLSKDKILTGATLEEANEPAHSGRHRIAAFEPVDGSNEMEVATLEARLRHEIEHARQYMRWGEELLTLNSVIDDLARCYGGERGYEAFYNAKPSERDAHAAAALLLRDRHGREVSAQILDTDSDWELAMARMPPGDLRELPIRSLSYAYSFAEMVQRENADGLSFEQWLDLKLPGAGAVWDAFEAAGHAWRTGR